MSAAVRCVRERLLSVAVIAATLTVSADGVSRCLPERTTCAGCPPCFVVGQPLLEGAQQDGPDLEAAVTREPLRLSVAASRRQRHLT